MMTRHYAIWPEGMPKSLDAPDRTLFANLAETAARFADRTALIFYGRTWTYADLLADAERLAGWMQAKAGIAKGDRVLLCVLLLLQVFLIGED